MTRSFWFPAVLVIVAGLVLLLASAAGWVAVEDARTVGDVVVTEPRSVSGTVYAPTAVVFGLVALLAGCLLGVVRGPARRFIGGACALAGVAGLAVVVQGLSRAGAAEGSVTPAPTFAAIGAVAVTLGAGLAARGPSRPPEASRYRVESERPEDEEWTVASEESP